MPPEAPAATCRPTPRTPWGAALAALIEQAWSRHKARLRARAARALATPEAELGPALAAITAQEARGWSRHRGYSSPF